MKNVLILIMISMFVVITATAQTTTTYPSEKVVIEKSKLPTELLKEIESDAKIAELEKKIETYGKWVGVGGEIGDAIRECLLALVDVAEKFGSTKIGTFALAMVAWKVMGVDILRIVIGLIFLIIFTTFLFRYYKTNFTIHKIAISDNGWRFWLPKQWQIVEPKTYDGYEFVKWLTILMMVGGFGITYAIMFA